MEIWKDIEGYEGLYQISTHGNVKSLKFGKEKILKPAKKKWLFICMFAPTRKSKNTPNT